VYLTGGDSNLYALSAARGTALRRAPLSGGAAVETNDQNLTALGPAVAGGVVYVASSDSKLYALSTSDGATLWSAGFAGGAASSPVVVNGLVCIAAYDDNVYGFAA
jgi:outer membrane protein assembly factor BamB